jgi:hypothetical protein
VTTALVSLVEAEDPQVRAFRQKIEAIFRANGVFEAEAAQKMLAMLDDVRNGLVAQIAGLPAGADGSFQAAHLRALTAAIEAASTEIQIRMGSLMSGIVEQSMTSGEDDTDDLIRLGGGDTSLMPLQISTDAFNIAQTAAADMVRYVSDSFVTAARQQISLGILGTKPAFTIMQDVAALLRTQPTRANPRLGTIAYQAERIVRTETNSIYSLTSHLRQQQAAEVTPSPLKSWITAHDARVRPAHVEAGRRYGQGGDPGPIPFDQAYLVGGERMQFPHDPHASAKERINCRCISIMLSESWNE